MLFLWEDGEGDKGSPAFLGSVPFALWGWMVNSSLPFPVPVPRRFSCVSLGMVAQLYFKMVTNTSPKDPGPGRALALLSPCATKYVRVSLGNRALLPCLGYPQHLGGFCFNYRLIFIGRKQGWLLLSAVV